MIWGVSVGEDEHSYLCTWLAKTSLSWESLFSWEALVSLENTIMNENIDIEIWKILQRKMLFI